MSEEVIEEVETPIIEDSEAIQDAEVQPTEYVEFHRKYQPRV